MTPIAAANGVTAAAMIYVAQSAFGSFIARPEFGESAPSWGSFWWIGAALLFGLALAICLDRFSGGVTIAVSVTAWLVSPIVAAVLMSDSVVAAINWASISILFAFTFHFSGWVALMVATFAVLLRPRWRHVW